MASITPSYVLAKNGIIDWQAWGQKLMIESLGYIKNVDEAKLQQVSEWVVEHDFWRKRRDDVIARLVKHREEGAHDLYCQQCGRTVHRAVRQAHRREVYRYADKDREWESKAGRRIGGK